MSYVYKLGGTSQCLTGYNKLINIIKNNSHQLDKVYIVLSAVSGVTNNLVKFTETKDHIYIDNAIKLNLNLISELNIDPLFFNYISSNLLNLCKKYTESFDMSDIYIKSEIIGYGEIMSTNILYIYFKLNDINCILLDSYDYIFSKKEIYQCNTQTEFYCKNNILQSNINVHTVFILQGFIGSTPSGKHVILGRGGSDTTGSLVAKETRAKTYEVWTDVDGIYTGDPKVFKYSFKINNIDYELCQELSAMGAKVMHPLSIKPCADINIPIIVKNTFSNSEGTIISNIKINETFYALQKSQTVFKIKSLDMWNSYGFITDIFRRFSENRIDINIVTTSQFSISATTSESNLYKLKEIKDTLSDKYEVEMINNCTIFSIVKRNIKDILNKLNFNLINPEIIHISDNDMTLNIVLNDYDLDKIFQIINI